MERYTLKVIALDYVEFRKEIALTITCDNNYLKKRHPNLKDKILEILVDVDRGRTSY